MVCARWSGYKNESLEQAFKRINKLELGVEIHRQNTECLGLYDHFYNDSFFDNANSTHYINAAHWNPLKTDNLPNIPMEQHKNYRWVHCQKVECDKALHQYSKVFVSELKKDGNKFVIL